MNYTLPSGMVINDVPDGMSEEELKRLAILNGLAMEEDFIPKEEPESGFMTKLSDLGTKAGAGTLEMLAGITDMTQPDPRPPGVWGAEEAAASAASFTGDLLGFEGMGQWGADKQAEIAKQYAEEDAKRKLAGEQSLEQERLGQNATRAAQPFSDSASYLREFYLSDAEKEQDRGLGIAVEGGIKELALFAIKNPGVVPSLLADSIAPMLLSGGAGRLLGAAGKGVGLSEKGVRAAGITGSVGGEAGVASVMNAEQTEKIIAQTPDDKLIQLPEAQEILKQNPNVGIDTVRRILSSRATNTTFATSLLSNLLVLGTSQALGANVVQDILAGTNRAASSSALKAGAKGFAGEFGQEFIQEAGDSVAGDLGSYSAGMMGADEVGSQAMASGLLGGIAGGPMGGVMGAATADSGINIDDAKKAELYKRKLAEKAAGYQRTLANNVKRDDSASGIQADDQFYRELRQKGGDPDEYFDLWNSQQEALTDEEAQDFYAKRKKLELDYIKAGILSELDVQRGTDTEDGIGEMLERATNQTEEIKPSVERPLLEEVTTFAPVARAVKKHMNQIGLKGIGTRLVNEVEYAVKDENNNILFGIRKSRGKADEGLLKYDKAGHFVYANRPDEKGFKAQGAFDPDLKTIFIATDSIWSPNMTAAQMEERVLSVLDHEKIHALKNLDLFTQKEWQVLVNAAKKETDSDGGTYYDWAKNSYKGKSEYVIEEESVAQLIRGQKKEGNKKLGGRPRTLMNRVFQFFEKMGNVLKGSGFNSFESVFSNIESGKIGGREQGVVRDFQRAKDTGSIVDIVAASDKRVAVKINELRGLQQKEEPSGAEENKIKALENEVVDLVQKGAAKFNLDPEKSLDDESYIRDQIGWHGSGAIFDKFSTDHIGEGEGAQVRGWGLYAGQQEKTGQHYYEMLGQQRVLINGKPFGQDRLPSSYDTDPYILAMDWFVDGKRQGMKWDEFAYNYIEWLVDIEQGDIDAKILLNRTHDFRNINELTKALTEAKKLVDGGVVKQTEGGALYKLDIPDNVVDAMLDLDKPISGQPRHIQELAKEIGWTGEDGVSTGEDLRVALENHLKDPSTRGETHVPVAKQASLYMLERGIPGSKFEDGWSRGTDRLGVYYGDVNTNDKSFAYPNDFTFEEEMLADRYLADITNEKMTPDEAVQNESTEVISFDGKLYSIDEFNALPGGKAAWMYEVSPRWNGGLKPTWDEFIKMIDSSLDPAAYSAESLAKAKEMAGKISIDGGKKSKVLKFLEKISIKEIPRTQNYVVFDDNDITIIDRNGKEITPKALRGGSIDNTRDSRPPLTSANPPNAPTFETPGEYSRAKRARWQLQDKIIGLLDKEEAIDTARETRGQAKIAATASPYKGEEASHGKIEQKARLFHDGLVDGLAKRLAGKKIGINKLDRFLVLRHAIERNERIRRVNPDKPDGGAGYMDGMELTDNNVKQEMKRLFNITWDDTANDWVGQGNRDYQNLKEIADNYVTPMINGTLSEALEGKLITQEEHDSLQVGGFYKHYVPLKGFGSSMFSEIDNVTHSGGAGAGGSMNIMGNQTRRATGRSSEAFSPISNLIADRERTIARGVKNKDIGVRLYDLIKSDPNDDVWKVYGSDDPYLQPYFKNQYAYKGSDPDLQGETKTTLEAGDSTRDWVKQVGSKTMTTITHPTTGQELLGVKVDGKQHFIWIADERLRQSLGNLSPSQGNWAVKTLGNINRMLSFVNTTLNPEFVIGNFFRDLETAVASVINENNMAGGMLEGSKMDTSKMIKQVVKGLPKSMKGFYNNARTGRSLNEADQAEIDEFLDAGAKAGWFHAKPAEDSRANLQQMVNMANGKKISPHKVMLSSKHFVEDVNAAVENAVRFSTFKVGKKAFMDAGLSKEEAVARAASMSKNMTINFNRKGESGNLINSLYLFFNAQVQGTAVVLRGVAGSNVKRGIMGGIAGMGALMSAFHDWMDDDDDKELKDHPDYVRERNMLLPGELFGMDSDVKIPLPYGYNFFYQLGSNAYLMSQGKMSAQKMSVETINSMMGAFNPMGAKDLFGSSLEESALRAFTPTAGTPAVEVLANRNYFGSPVYKEDIQFGTPKPDSHRSFKNTDKTLKWLTEGVNKLTQGNESVPGYIDVSPDTVSYMIGYALGGAGTFGQRAITKPLGNIAAGKAPFEEWNDVPFIRRFIQEESSKPDVGLYYDRRDKIDQKLAHVEASIGNERRDYARKNREYLAFKPVYTHIEKQLKVLRQRQKMIDEVIARNPSKGVELAENQQRIQDAIDKLINKVNKLYETKVGE